MNVHYQIQVLYRPFNICVTVLLAVWTWTYYFFVLISPLHACLLI